jgi:hypothetical protein
MDENGKIKVSEPQVSYKKITISSIEDQKVSQRKYFASLSPEERFDSFYELMGRFYDFKTSFPSGAKIVIGL